jgi:hypothetical protein
VKVQARLATLFQSALSQSMPVDLMQKLARTVIPDYDIYERSGFPSNIPMPRKDAARQILKDVTREGSFLRLIESLITMASDGDMGREVRVPLLSRIVAEMEEAGYRYSREKGTFVEAAERGRTMGWGTLEPGKTYEFALLRADIVGNTRLVRRYPRAQIKAVYDRVKEMMTRTVERRDGRVWSWEGDGGVAAFYFVDKTIRATLCGIDILHELFLFNLLGNGLPEPVLVRLAVHAGPCRLLNTVRESSSDTLRRLELLESSYTQPGTMTVSPGVFTDVGSKLSPHFIAVPGPDSGNVYRYALDWEKK